MYNLLQVLSPLRRLDTFWFANHELRGKNHVESFIKFERLNKFNITFSRIYETFNDEAFTCEEQIMFSEIYAVLLCRNDEGER